MQEVLLSVNPVPDDVRLRLSESAVKVVTADDLSPKDIPSVTIMYGWDPELGHKIITSEHNNLKWVQHLGTGVNDLPLDILKQQGVQVTNASGEKSVPIAQTILGYILFVARGINEYHLKTTWAPDTNQYTLSELPTIIFGTGKIGTQIATYIKALGGHVVGVNTTGLGPSVFNQIVRLHDVQDVAQSAKVLVNTLPGTAETINLFDESFLSQFNDLQLFINTGRGDSVDQDALLKLINAGKIGFAALDVTTPEPLPDGHPLLTNPKVLVTQHTSWAEHHAPKRPDTLWKVVLQNIPAYLRGDPLPFNRVDLQKGY